MDSKIRVLLLASGDLWAGAEVMVYQLATGLARFDSVHLKVVLLNHGRLAEELGQKGIAVKIADESVLSAWQLASEVRKIIREFSPDLIHSHRYKENLLAWIGSGVFHRSCKLVATQHGMPEGDGASLKSRLRTSMFFRLLAHVFNATVVVSHEMLKALAGSYGFTAQDGLKVIHNGITLPAAMSEGRQEQLRVGSAGRLFPVKGFSLLLDIAKLVTANTEEIDFFIAGDGPQEAELKRGARQLGLEGRVHFVGHQEDMAAFYRSLDIYINTSVHEGIPMSVLEAMSYGLPVVAPRVGGFPEIVMDGEGGYLVDGRNPEDFAAKIMILVDQGKRHAMAQAAREQVEKHFTSEAMADKYLRLYRKLVCLP